MINQSDKLSLLVHRLKGISHGLCIWRLKNAHTRHSTLGILSMLGQSPKVGPKRDAAVFNIPLLSCKRGIATSIFVSVCIFHKMSEGRTNVYLRAQNNYIISQRPDFPALAIAAIRKSRVSVIRIHTFGDFYSRLYISDWIQIVRECPNVVFIAYTRSWRRPAHIPSLTRLAEFPNMNLLLSFDIETGVPPEIPHTRRAWLATNDSQIPPIKSLIAFRSTKEKDLTTRRKPVLTHLNGTTVCPHLNGRVISRKNATCLTCRICLFHERG